MSAPLLVLALLHGQEIASFFNRYGMLGLYGMVLSCILFAIIIIYVLFIVDKKKINSFDELIYNNRILKFLEEIFLFISFCIMIAAIGAFFEEQFEMQRWAGALIGSAICFLIFMYRYKGLEVFNTALTPIIIIGILFVALGKYDLDALYKIKYKVQDGFTDSFLLSSVLYVGYNSLILIPILVKLKTYNLTKVQKYCVSLGAFAVLCLLGVLLFRVIDMFYPQIMVFELPTLKLASMLGNKANFIFGFIILFAIFTTAISSGFAFLEMNDDHYLIKNFVLCLSGFVLSNVGFSYLVNTLFPIFGYVGIIEIIVILCRGVITTNHKGESSNEQN